MYLITKLIVRRWPFIEFVLRTSSDWLTGTLTEVVQKIILISDIYTYAAHILVKRALYGSL